MALKQIKQDIGGLVKECAPIIKFAFKPGSYIQLMKKHPNKSSLKTILGYNYAAMCEVSRLGIYAAFALEMYKGF